MISQPRHIVAVIGGAVSGSVAAEILAAEGVEVVVLEQNAKPYGKIEDGLPRWHDLQREREYGLIDARLTKPGVLYVPLTEIGRDVSFEALTRDWGFSAVLLANGAWRDRPLPVKHADEYVGRGVEYQNPLIHWFNHREEPDYDGREIDLPEGAVVVGGGLASVDVVKVLQIENYRRALAKRGIEVDVVTLEKSGIPAVCEEHGLEPGDLGIRPCTLVYRRARGAMPLVTCPPNASPTVQAKIMNSRGVLLDRARNRYLFEVRDRTLPLEDGLVVEDGRVTGLRVVRTDIEDGRVVPVPGSEEILETSLIVSSIGSVPAPIEGIRMNGETYDFADRDQGVYDEEAGVFGVGNVVTGQGNIRASLLHARQVAKYLSENWFSGAIGAAGAEVVRKHLAGMDPLDLDTIDRIHTRVAEQQERAGYDGDYAAWIARHRA